MVVRSAALAFQELDCAPFVLALSEDMPDVQSILDIRVQNPSNPIEKEGMNLRRQLTQMLQNKAYSALKYSFQFGAAHPLPAAAVSNWNTWVNRNLKAKEQELSDYDDAYQKAAALVLLLAQTDWFRRAMLYASHTILGALDAPVDVHSKKGRALLRSLWMYLSRAATKTTPLGRFVTLDIQDLGSDPSGFVFPEIKAHATPNVAFLPLIYTVLLQNPVFYRQVPIRLNPSVTESDQIFSWLYFNGEHEAFQTLNSNEALARLIPLFAHPITILQVQEKCADEFDPQALENYLIQLIHHGLLEWKLPETGLTASWCSNLYQFLGFLPTEPVIVETTYLLAWLRNASRGLAHVPWAEALELQRAAHAMLKSYFEKHKLEMPGIPPEQVFFEDCAQTQTRDVQLPALEDLLLPLKELLDALPPQPVGGLRRQIQIFGRNALQVGERMPFLVFCRSFLAARANGQIPDLPEAAPVFRGCTGVMLQAWRAHEKWHGVVNGLFVGGGKMAARWLHLFPSDCRNEAEAWLGQGNLIPFPWHDWNNANFQPLGCLRVVECPDARRTEKTALKVCDLQVRMNEHLQLELWDPHIQAPFYFTDLGLESPGGKPPVMQVLWHLGMPLISLNALLPPSSTEDFYRPRISIENLVLRRASWKVDFRHFLEATGHAEFFLGLQRYLRKNQMPARFFVQAGREKPQFIDANNPVAVLVLERICKKHPDSLVFTELLPQPEGIAQEWVLEYR